MKPFTYVLLSSLVAVLGVIAAAVRFGLANGAPPRIAGFLWLFLMFFFLWGIFSTRIRDTFSYYAGQAATGVGALATSLALADDLFSWILFAFWILLAAWDLWQLSGAWKRVPESARISGDVWAYPLPRS